MRSFSSREASESRTIGQFGVLEQERSRPCEVFLGLLARALAPAACFLQMRGIPAVGARCTSAQPETRGPGRSQSQSHGLTETRSRTCSRTHQRVPGRAVQRVPGRAVQRVARQDLLTRTPAGAGADLAGGGEAGPAPRFQRTAKPVTWQAARQVAEQVLPPRPGEHRRLAGACGLAGPRGRATTAEGGQVGFDCLGRDAAADGVLPLVGREGQRSRERAD